MGTTNAHTGDRISGLVTFHAQLSDYREYLMTQLNCPLIPGVTYELSFWSTGGNPVEYIYRSNNIEVNFSSSPLVQSGYNLIQGISPQISLDTLVADLVWKQYTFQFTPTQPYSYMTIGNFRDDASTQTFTFGTNRPYAYYFFDDITLVPIKTNFLGNDTAFCSGQTLTLGLSYPGATYQWQDNSTGSSYNVNSPGTYSLTITTTAGCSVTDTINITEVSAPPQINLGADKILCGNAPVALDAGVNVLWNTGAYSSQITAGTPGLYWAQASNACGSFTDSVIVSALAPPTVTLGADTFFCKGDSITVMQLSLAANYVWSTGDTSNSITITAPGQFWIEVWDTTLCRNRDTINIFQPTGYLNLGADTTICGPATILLSAFQPFSTYIWHDNSTDSVYTVSQTGTYSATVSTPCGTASDEILVQILPDECQLHMPTAFSPNSDGVNDVYRGVSRCGAQRYHLQLYNRWGNLVFETTDVSQGWNGIYKSAPQPTDVYIYQVEYFNYCAQKQLKLAGNFTLLR